MQNKTRESVIEALAMLPAAFDRLWLQLDSMARDDWIADVIQRDLALLQRLPHQNREPNSAKKDVAELRTDLAAQLRALPEADWTHHFLMDDVWLSIEELLARHIAADCLAVQQLLELATPVEAESAAPKVLHARQLAGTNTFSRQRIQRTTPYHLKSTNVVAAPRGSRLRRIFNFFFEAFIEDARRQHAEVRLSKNQLLATRLTIIVLFAGLAHFSALILFSTPMPVTVKWFVVILLTVFAGYFWLMDKEVWRD